VTVTHDRLFVFAGAGVSLSTPAGLAQFSWLRDELLAQLGLTGYVPATGDVPLTHQQQAARGLAPEPFILALRRSGVDILGWLRATLSGGTPNAAHVALAQLAERGAAVWTVNFDELIERAGAGLAVSAWPDPPAPLARLLKPHGTVGGALIADSEQVLLGLGAGWLTRLRADVAGRTVVFVGYSGRDLDFQPLWDDVLQAAARVLWFDVALPADELRRRQAMLRRVDAAGRLTFATRPPATPGAPSNPSGDFVRWCESQGLVAVDPVLTAALYDTPPGITYPRLSGALAFGAAATQQILGDAPAARRTYAEMIRTGPDRRTAARALLDLTLNHGGPGVARALAAGFLVPPLGPARRLREMAGRKRVTILANLGQHATVLRATRSAAARKLPVPLMLRSAALRMTGSLDDAAETAAEALRLALAQAHPVRVAHAAFQRGLALVWAYRLAEARENLENVQRPYATIASNRWVAWADFVEAGLEIHHRSADAALRAVERGAARFRAEGLVDGRIDMETIRLTALRLGGDRSGYQRCRADLQVLLDPARRSGTHYARGHRFTLEAIALEDSEFARVHLADLDQAERHALFAAQSQYPIHTALGSLALAAVHRARGEPLSTLDTARTLGRRINARLIETEADRLAALAGSASAFETFFP
jgi:hypothetical protein